MRPGCEWKWYLKACTLLWHLNFCEQNLHIHVYGSYSRETILFELFKLKKLTHTKSIVIFLMLQRSIFVLFYQVGERTAQRDQEAKSSALPIE